MEAKGICFNVSEYMKLEVCCGNIASVKAAIDGGADRIELCRDLELDGLTPSQEMIREAVSLCHPAGLLVHVLVRSRDGNFVYDDAEVEKMENEIRMAVGEGADGVVIGALTPDGYIDVDACRKWIDAVQLANGHLCRNVTFHRAFDVCNNPLEAIWQVARLGCNRILTSGQQSTAEKGIPLLKQLVRKAEEISAKSGHEFSILCGAGVNTLNASMILKETGATEIHGSLRTGLVSDAQKIRQVKRSIS